MRNRTISNDFESNIVSQIIDNLIKNMMNLRMALKVEYGKYLITYKSFISNIEVYLHS